jgi:hypothetical protein
VGTPRPLVAAHKPAPGIRGVDIPGAAVPQEGGDMTGDFDHDADTQAFISYMRRHNLSLGKLTVAAMQEETAGVLDLDAVERMAHLLREAAERCDVYVEKHKPPIVIEARQDDVPMITTGESHDDTH